MMRRNLARSALAIVAVCLTGATVEAGARLRNIQRQGYLTCGVAPGVAGFAEVDAQGRYRGLDVDICRALSAAIFGHPDQVRYVPALSVAAFRRSRNIDVVSRRLTWELGREAPLGLLFGPIMFYDGQGFLVSKTLGAGNGRQLSGAAICVAAGTPFEFNVGVYFRANSLELRRVLLDSPDRFDAIAEALATGRCSAYTADVSELGAIRSRMSRPADFDILTDQITKEPLAQLVPGWLLKALPTWVRNAGNFWEGTCSVEGTINGKPVKGDAFGELLHCYPVPHPEIAEPVVRRGAAGTALQIAWRVTNWDDAHPLIYDLYVGKNDGPEKQVAGGLEVNAAAVEGPFDKGDAYSVRVVARSRDRTLVGESRRAFVL